MVKNRLNFDEIQDQHLDEMIRLAFKHADALEAQYIMESCSNTNEMNVRYDEKTAYVRYLEKLKAEEKQEKRRSRTARIRKWVPRMVETAACLVLIVGIAAPIAIANVESIRSRVLEALIQVQEKYTEIGMIESEEDAFYVPEEWKGQYYPTYIPNGYELKEIGQFVMYLEYENEDGELLTFDECTESSAVSVDSEGAIISYDKICGSEAMFIEKDDVITLIWWTEDRYFVIDSRESRSEMIRIAENVKKILN